MFPWFTIFTFNTFLRFCNICFISFDKFVRRFCCFYHCFQIRKQFMSHIESSLMAYADFACCFVKGFHCQCIFNHGYPRIHRLMRVGCDLVDIVCELFSASLAHIALFAMLKSFFDKMLSGFTAAWTAFRTCIFKLLIQFQIFDNLNGNLIKLIRIQFRNICFCPFFHFITSHLKMKVHKPIFLFSRLTHFILHSRKRAEFHLA